MTPRRLTAALLTCGLLLLGCNPALTPRDPDPGASLQPGLQLLQPYDHGPRTNQGVRWLENFALAHAGRPEALHARLWILRARVDWLTWAYLLDDPQQRHAAFFALLDHLNLPHEPEPRSEDLDALLNALEDQARGLAAAPATAAPADSALRFLLLLRHLNLDATYYTAADSLGLAHSQPLPPWSPDSPHTFAPNALLIVLANLHALLPDALNADPGRQSHELARLLAFSCPAGLTAFAQAPLEDRLDALQHACPLPCPDARTDADVQTCLKTLDLPRTSLDSYVYGETTAALTRLQRQGAALLATPDDAAQSPLLAQHRAALQHLLDTLPPLAPDTALPGWLGWSPAADPPLPLYPARYLPIPEVTPTLILLRPDGFTVAELDGLPGLPFDPAADLTALDAIAQARGGWNLLAPLLILPLETPLGRLRPLLRLLAQRGVPGVAFAAWDAALHRTGALPLHLTTSPPRGGLELNLGPTTAVLDGGTLPKRLQATGDDATPAWIYRHLTALAEPLPEARWGNLTLRIEDATPLRTLLATLDALRFWRELEKSEEVREANPQGSGVPRVLTAKVTLSVE